MKNLRHRVAVLLVVIAMFVGTLACSTGSLIGRSDPTATPTKTPKPTFTPTATPTQTLIPTNTPIPSPTQIPTNTPVPPTNTPVVQTATHTPEPLPPTSTPVPPTRTPKPTSKPKPKPTKTNTPIPQPTNTPRPQYAWSGQVTNTFQNCGVTRLFGFTLDRGGGLAGDIWVHYWADGWEGDWAQSGWVDFGAGTSWKGDEGNWDGTIDVSPRDGTWHVCVAPEDGSWTCISDTVDATTSSDCVSGIQVVQITFTLN